MTTDLDDWEELAAHKAAIEKAIAKLAAQVLPEGKERRRRLYLAGPMSGLPEHNYPAFHAAAAFYEAQGYQVENPANNVVTDPHKGEQLWAAFMRLSIPQMLRCDCVVALDGWEQSRGAVLELYLARQLGIPCFAHQQLQDTFQKYPMEEV